MKDMWTLYKFLKKYFKDAGISDKQHLVDIICNMGISNCTVSQIKELITETSNDKSISDEDVFEYISNLDNIPKIQDKSRYLQNIAPRGTTIQRATNGDQEKI